MPRTNMRDLSFAMVNLLNLQVEVPGGLTYGSSPPFPDDAEGRAAYERKIAWLADRVRLLEIEVVVPGTLDARGARRGVRHGGHGRRVRPGGARRAGSRPSAGRAGGAPWPARAAAASGRRRVDAALPVRLPFRRPARDRWRRTGGHRHDQRVLAPDPARPNPGRGPQPHAAAGHRLCAHLESKGRHACRSGAADHDTVRAHFDWNLMPAEIDTA